MKSLAILLTFLCLSTACSPSSEQLVEGQDNDRPQRIVSLDYCADQYVLKFVDPHRILAVSPDAKKSFSYMRNEAEDIPSIRPWAEDVILQKPDLVVRSYGGGPNAAHFFEQAGIPVLNIGWASNLDDIERVIQQMADGLGETEKGVALVQEMQKRLASIPISSSTETALYMTSSGVTTGPGSLVHQMLLAGNYENFQTQPGWQSLPLERLAYEQPDAVAVAIFEGSSARLGAWSAMRHPIAKKQIEDLPTTMLEGAWTTCGSWFLVDAIEALSLTKAESDD